MQGLLFQMHKYQSADSATHNVPLHGHFSVMVSPYANTNSLPTIRNSLTLYQPMTHRCVMTFVNSP